MALGSPPKHNYQFLTQICNDLSLAWSLVNSCHSILQNVSKNSEFKLWKLHSGLLFENQSEKGNGDIIAIKWSSPCSDPSSWFKYLTLVLGWHLVHSSVCYPAVLMGLSDFLTISKAFWGQWPCLMELEIPSVSNNGCTVFNEQMNGLMNWIAVLFYGISMKITLVTR